MAAEKLDIKKLGRQYQATAIADSLENCRLMTEKIWKEIGVPHYEQRLLVYLRELSGVLTLLVDASRRSDDRAVDHEDRLEKLEQQFEEWKKQYPIPDGK